VAVADQPGAPSLRILQGWGFSADITVIPTAFANQRTQQTRWRLEAREAGPIENF